MPKVSVLTPYNYKNIVFAINDGYAWQLCVTVASVLENNQNVRFVVLANDLTDASKQKIEAIVSKYPNAAVKFVRPDKELFANLKLNMDHISIETYFRYVIPDILPDEDRCLYLDADLVVNANLDSFYNLDLGTNYCAGVADIGPEIAVHKPTIGFADSDMYINAGVLLMNLRQMRKDNIVAQLFKNNLDLADQIYYQDQDIINITLRGRIVPADCIYNFETNLSKNHPTKRWQAKIIHYTGSVKPWHKSCPHKLRRVWHKYDRCAKKLVP